MTNPNKQFDPRVARGAPFFSILVVGLIAAALLLDSKSSNPLAAAKLSTDECESWDRDAVEGLIPLMYQGTAAAELKLNEALAQLRRARSYCKDGFVAVARNDYTVLHHAFPILIGAIGSPVKTAAPKTPDSTLINVKN
jgi:hypothetical protein